MNLDDYLSKCHQAVAEFKKKLLRSLLPREMDDNEAVEFLTANAVQFVVFPNGREELHGFGKKLGDVFCSVESDDPKNGVHFVTRFTPSNQ